MALQPSKTQQQRWAILVNTIAPYRLPIYTALAAVFDTLVLHGGREANRSWQLDIPPSLHTREVWTLQIPLKKQTGVAGVWDTQYVHLNGGLLWELPKFQPDAIITNELGMRTLIALLYGRLFGVPVWVQWEGSPHSERHISRSKQFLRYLLAKRVHHWISYGASSSAYLRSLGAPGERLLEVQNCVPHQTFVQAPQGEHAWFAEKPRPVILSVGQLIPRKGLHLLVAACGRLAARGVAFTLVLVGEGPERQRLGQQASDVGLLHFQMLPNQTQEALNNLYKDADVFVLPTLEDVWGLVVSEALWAGTPVLCSQYAGCAEVVPEENLFDPTSDSSFDEALAKIFDNSVRAAATERLLTCENVSDRITRSLTGVLCGAALPTPVEDNASEAPLPQEF